MGRRSGHRNDPPLIPNQTGGIGETARRRGVEVSRLARQALRPSSGQVQAVSGVKLPWRLPTPKCQQRQAAIPSFSRFANGFELLISQLVNTVCSGVSVYSFSRHLHSHPLPSSCSYFILVGPVVDGVLVVFFAIVYPVQRAVIVAHRPFSPYRLPCSAYDQHPFVCRTNFFSQ
ncbi:hypothetical protein BO85DRAFT_508565 [Aspergillus piperis CBS 112811]|uniref:Uncharacterized protein n=1 Tax=Aspergillus piperis CBS 112811 TaxID=1448313 RepID=A0A8G1QTA6_9EURO|nr:hypothetical protein BO85DRAFT_508565 [Aspergillus piperis CBS 112811]RAH51885.1 hypothetical protein BO85DRAFT_508565 [Aspergillus piperis CBS 112811]